MTEIGLEGNRLILIRKIEHETFGLSARLLQHHNNNNMVRYLLHICLSTRKMFRVQISEAVRRV